MRRLHAHLAAICTVLLADPLGNVGSADEGRSASGIVFATDFEEERPFERWQTRGPGATIERDPGPQGRAENMVARLRAPAGRRGGSALVGKLPQGYDKLYARWFIKYERGFDFSARGHGGGLYAGRRELLGRSDVRPDGADMASVIVDYSNGRRYPRSPFLYVYYRGMYMDCRDPRGACWGDAFPCVYDPPAGVSGRSKVEHRVAAPLPQLEADRWYNVEIMVDLGAPSSDAAHATGALELAVDGRSLGRWPHLWMRTNSSLELSYLWLSLFHHDGRHSDVGVMYDDVVVSSQPIP